MPYEDNTVIFRVILNVSLFRCSFFKKKNLNLHFLSADNLSVERIKGRNAFIQIKFKQDY